MTALTAVTIKGPFDAVTAGSLDFTWAAGSTDGDTIAITGRQIIMCWNSSVDTAYTVTVDSVDDEMNRQGDITTYSLAADDYAVFGVGLTNEQGWKTAAGIINLDVENTAVKWAVLTLPAMYP